MVQINFAQKTVTAKIVYYGPGMSGKTTNLEVIHQRAPENNRGSLTSISTDGDRTLFFDFMPLDLGTVAGMRTSFQVYTVPGQVYYNSTRKLVLQGVDGVIFVADSSASMTEENLESLRNLNENLAEYGKSLATLPHIIQFNKRDLPDAMSVDQLNELLNQHGVPTFEAVANTGQGVFPTLKALAAKVLESIHSNHMASGQTSAPAKPLAQAPAPMPAPMPAQAPAAARGAQPAKRPAPAQQKGAPIPAPRPAAAAPPPPPAFAPAPAPAMQAAAASDRPLQMAQTSFQNLASTSFQPPRAMPAPAPQPKAVAYHPAPPVHETPVATQQRQPARPAAAPAAPQRQLEGSRFRPRTPAPRPAPRPTPVSKRSGGNWIYTTIFVALALAVGGVVTKIALSYFS